MSAFLWDPAGRGWRLSPLYDVVPHPQLGTERRLHLSLGPLGRTATLANLLDAHGQFGLFRPEATDIVDRVSRVVREWRTRFEDLGIAPEQCDRIASAFRSPRELGLG